MDLSKLSDDDLLALRAGDLSKVSNDGLIALRGESQPAQQPARPSDMGYLAETASNVPRSAGRLVSGIVDAVTSPVQSAKSMMDLGVGAFGKMLPESFKRGMNEMLPPTEEQAANVSRADNTASAFGQTMKQRYGGAQNIADTFREDPVGVAADLSTVLTGASGLTRAAGVQGAANVLSKGAKYTNPLSVVAPAAKAVGGASKYALGLTTGVGPENISQAAKAGYLGDKSFIQNLSGQASMTDLLVQAKEGLRNMRETRSGVYAQNIADTAADTARLNFSPIDQKLSNVVDSMKYANKWKIGKDQISKIKELEKIVQEWRIDSSLHTPMGLDALKQRLDALYPDSPMQSQAQRAITTVRNAVKDTIVQQSPKYADTMKAYEEAIKTEREIERALSLGNKASQDTALRKLQSLSRNNVNTNYGNRLDLAKALETEGGVSLMPSISGQAMNSWTARGLGGQLENIGTLAAAAFHNPMLAAALPFQSPKAVGASLYGLGRAAGGVGSVFGRAGLNPDVARSAGLFGYQLGREPEQVTDW